jgi:hypothetical protein
MGSLRDYITAIPAVIAVTNSMIVVLLSNYPFATPTAKMRFILIAFLLSFVAVAATIYSVHRGIAKRSEERGRIVANRETLGAFITEGNQLLGQAANQNSTLPDPAANEWATRVESFLTENIGGSYVARFRDATAVPAIFPEGVDDAHARLWRGIYGRLLRLEQFSQEQITN